MDKDKTIAAYDLLAAKIEQMHTRFNKECDELGRLIAAMNETIMVGDVPVSAASLTPESLQVVYLHERRKAAQEKLSGPTSLLVKYLSSKIIEGGRGFIMPIPDFKQYDDDILFASTDSLKKWPCGFYRNRKNQEVQLLLRTVDGTIICIDGLPSNKVTVMMSIPVQDAHGTVIMLDVVKLDNEKIEELAVKLDDTLSWFTKAHSAFMS